MAHPDWLRHVIATVETHDPPLAQQIRLCLAVQTLPARRRALLRYEEHLAPQLLPIHQHVHIGVLHHLCRRLLHDHADITHSRSRLKSIQSAYNQSSAEEPTHSESILADLCVALRLESGPDSSLLRRSLLEQALKSTDLHNRHWPTLASEYLYSHIDSPDSADATAKGNNLLAIAKTNPRVNTTKLLYALTDAHLELGTYSLARDALGAVSRMSLSASQLYRHRIYLARIEGAEGRPESSIHTLPTRDEVATYPWLWEPWVRAIYTLVEGGHIPLQVDTRIALLECSNLLHERGAIWPSGQILSRLTGLEFGCGEIASAKVNLARLTKIGTELSNHACGTLHLDKLTALGSTRLLPPSPVASQDVHLPPTETFSFDQVVAINQEHPGRWDSAETTAEMWRALGQTTAALGVYKAASANGASVPIERLCALLMQEKRFGELGVLLDNYPELSPSLRAFYRASIAEHHQDFDLALKCLATTRSDRAIDLKRVRLLCHMNRELEALALLEQLIGMEEPGPADWERIRLATLLGRWDAVRHSGNRLGMRFIDQNGPVEESWEYCLVAYPDDRLLIAKRTGPMTARILPVLGEDERERHNELVMFNPVPRASASKPDGLACYSVIRILERSEWRGYSVRGVHPGDEATEQFKTRLSTAGYATWIWSQAQTQLPTGVRMLYLAVAIPPNGSPEELHQLLTISSPKRLVWTRLVQEVGSQQEQDEQVSALEDLFGVRR